MSRPSRTSSGLARYRVTIEVAPEAEAAWNRWHEEHHVPELLVLPGFLGATKWRDAATGEGGWARYVVEYRLTDGAALDTYVSGPDAKRLRADHEAHFGATTRASRQLLALVRDWAEGG
jgi:antibiotic biosynthesis monooxygenase (ABM) superfamily enzyme